MNTIVPLLLGLNAAFALGLASIALARRRTPGARPFTVMMVALAAWSAANAATVLLSEPALKQGLARLAHLFIVTVVVSWWTCCAAYAGRVAFLATGRLLLAALPGLVSILLAAAGPRTTLMWSTLEVHPGPGPVAFPPGPWFLVHSVWAFVLVLGGVQVVARTMFRAPRAYRPQLTVLFIGIVIPLIVNAATVQSGLVATGGHDFTPIATLASAVVFGLGLLRFGLLDLAVGVVPVAHDAVVSSMRDGIVIVDPDGRILEVNAAAVSVLGRTAAPPLGVPVTTVLPGWTPDASSEIELGPADGRRIVEVTSSPIGGSRGTVIMLRDVTSARDAERAMRESLERASHQARHDHLTGLPNRRLLFDALLRQRGAYALLIIDLDGFKSVNDSYGHGAGDEVLSQLARRLRGVCRPDAVVARLGGDEFAVLLPGASAAQAELAARTAVDALSAPILIEGREVVLSASAGIARFPQHGTHSDEIVRAADVAMYSAKRTHRRVAIYGHADDARSPGRVLLAQELRRALASDEIVCHYQIQVTPGGTIRGVEALVRWQHPERGLLRPAAFLKAARQGGLMRQVAERVMDVALRQLRAWEAEGRSWTLSINLDAEDLSDARLVGRVDAALTRAGVRPDRLTVEVTESAVFDTSAGARALEGLRQLGVATALDDFGTGYGPLAHLRQLPIDQLKLDRSFVSGLTRDRRDAALVAGQIRIGHDLGLLVVAEGVETAASATRLVELQCDLLQGYYLGAPADASELTATTVQMA